MPSARTRFVKDNNQKLILYSILVVAAFMLVSNYYLYSFMHAVKFVVMIAVSIIATREFEILYYTMYFNIDRYQAKELIAKSYYLITALLYALIIPLGTPIWLVTLGAIMATFFGKLMFGGYHHMVFHTSLVGFLFVTLGWTGLAVSADFVNSFDSFIFKTLFDYEFFNVPGSGVFDPSLMETSLSMLMNGNAYDLLDVILGTVPGIIGNGIVLLGVLVFLIAKKAVNYITPVVLISTTFVTALIVGIVNGEDLTYPIYHIFSGGFLFVVVFFSTDPITTPIPTAGKIVYAVIAGMLTVFIRIAGTYEEGIFFGVLFMSMLTPMLNVELKKKKKPVKAKVKKEGA